MKRTEIGAYEAEQIASLLQERHGKYLKEDEFFEVSGYTSYGEVFTQVTLRNRDESFFYPVECRVELAEIELNEEGARDLLLDFQDYYFGRFLSEGRDIFLTIDWSAYQFDVWTLYARGQILNRKLERLADLWLAGEGVSEEALEGKGKKIIS